MKWNNYLNQCFENSTEFCSFANQKINNKAKYTFFQILQHELQTEEEINILNKSLNQFTNINTLIITINNTS